jgi:hypothetical protein
MRSSLMPSEHAYTLSQTIYLLRVIVTARPVRSRLGSLESLSPRTCIPTTNFAPLSLNQVGLLTGNNLIHSFSLNANNK